MAMRVFRQAAVCRAIQTILAIGLISTLGGCFGPDYGPTYGYPTYGYSPYSYGLPVYAGGYAPAFVEHHPWEDHHSQGHHDTFYRPPGEVSRFGVPHVGASVPERGPHENWHR
jgi:hypothetical protein